MTVEEILLAGCSQPLRVTDLRSKLREVATSDASETGESSDSVFESKVISEG